MRKRTVMWLFAASALCLVTLLAGAPAMALTTQQIVQRCRAAYDALRTYQGTVTVTAGSGPQTYHTSARIVFARPGKIRASGSSMIGGPYAFVSNGTATYQDIAGTWSRSRSAEIAIASATGIAQSAATTIPALLLHTHWGQPFPPGLPFRPEVVRAATDGHSCYRITAATPAGSETYWIDCGTFLLRRVVTTFAMGRIHLRQDEHVVNGPLNAPIPAGAFALPAVQ